MLGEKILSQHTRRESECESFWDQSLIECEDVLTTSEGSIFFCDEQVFMEIFEEVGRCLLDLGEVLIGMCGFERKGYDLQSLFIIGVYRPSRQYSR